MAHGIDERHRADDDQPEGDEHLEVDDAQARAVGGLDAGRAPGIEPVEAQRREVLDVDGRVGLEVALDVPAVDDEERAGHHQLRPGRVGREERGSGDGQAVGDRERTHVRAEDLGVHLEDVAGRAVPRLVHDRGTGHEHRQRREHERRAEDRPDQMAVVSDEVPPASAQARNMEMIVERDGVRIRATSDGPAYILLPVQFSHCLRVVNAAPVRLIRANLMQTLISFDRTLDARLEFRFGLFADNTCRLRDGPG